MRRPLLLFVACGASLIGTEAPATQPPRTASPGSTEHLARAGERCPTFSWGAVPEAVSFHLAVYDATGESAEPQLVVSVELPAAVSSWTPSLERCLVPGRVYAWRLGAVGKDGGVSWSEPAWFDVDQPLAEVPSAWVDQVIERLSVTQPVEVPPPSGAARALPLPLPSRTESRLARAATFFAVGSGGAVTAGAMAVEGTVTAGAFVGDGSGLTGIGSGTGGVENTGSTTIGADTDSTGEGVIDLQTRGTTRVVVTNAGKVGIGTAIPSESLQVNGKLRVDVGGSANKVVCWKADNTLGYCSTQPSASGSCTCN